MAKLPPLPKKQKTPLTREQVALRHGDEYLAFLEGKSRHLNRLINEHLQKLAAENGAIIVD